MKGKLGVAITATLSFLIFRVRRINYEAIRYGKRRI